MSAQAQKRADAIKKQEKALEDLNSELKADLAQSALDVAGIADPTPITDCVSAAISLWRGDLIGAGLSLISAVPYAGDALGKTAKGARLAAKMEKLRKKIAAATDALQAAKKQVREYAAAAVRAKKQAKKAGAAVDDAVCKSCMKNLDETLETPFGTRGPAKGTWGGTRGNSDWVPDESSSYGKKLLAWQEKNGAKHGIAKGDAIPYKEGFPDFSKYVHKTPNGTRAEVPIKMTGKNADDFKAADDAMKALDPNYSKPPGMTWHHKEDGVTMQLVPSAVNRVPHDGGASLVKQIPDY